MLDAGSACSTIAAALRRRRVVAEMRPSVADLDSVSRRSRWRRPCRHPRPWPSIRSRSARCASVSALDLDRRRGRRRPRARCCRRFRHRRRAAATPLESSPTPALPRRGPVTCAGLVGFDLRRDLDRRAAAVAARAAQRDRPGRDDAHRPAAADARRARRQARAVGELDSAGLHVDRARVAGRREEARGRDARCRDSRRDRPTPFVPVAMNASGATMLMLPPAPAALRDAADARAVQRFDDRRLERDVAAAAGSGRARVDLTPPA